MQCETCFYSIRERDNFVVRGFMPGSSGYRTKSLSKLSLYTPQCATQSSSEIPPVEKGPEQRNSVLVIDALIKNGSGVAAVHLDSTLATRNGRNGLSYCAPGASLCRASGAGMRRSDGLARFAILPLEARPAQQTHLVCWGGVNI